MDLSVIAAFLVQAFVPSLTLLTPLVTWALGAGIKYISQKTKNEAVEMALTRVSHTVETIVDSLTQTMAQSLREQSKDGKLTSEDAMILKDKAVSAVFRQVPISVQKLAEEGVNNLGLFVSDKIEKAVLKQKISIMDSGIIGYGTPELVNFETTVGAE